MSFSSLISCFLTATGVFSNIKGLTYYRNAEDDPFITLKEVSPALTALTTSTPACK